MINTKLMLLFKSLKEVFFACPRYNIAMAIILIIIGLMPALNVYAIGELVSLFEHKQANFSIVAVIVIWGISMLLPSLLEPLTNYLQSHINQLVTNKITSQIIKKNASFNGLHAYDDTNIQDAVAVLKTHSKFRPTNFSVNVVIITREIITIFSLSIILYLVKWWIPFAVLISTIPLAYINFKVASFSWQALMDSGKQTRIMDYFSSISFLREAQKDIHLFGAYDLIIKKYNTAFEHVYSTLKKAQLKTFIKPIPFQIVTTLVISIILFSLYEQSRQAVLQISSVVVLLQSIFLLNGRLEGLIQHSSILYEILDYFEKYFSFLDYSEDIKDGSNEIHEIETIEFINVSFKYPNSQSYALKNVCFSAKIGESIAIVGRNGAGKSTLVQLICRFWDATEGKILINGNDIASYKILHLRNCIGAVFQDFFKFNMTISENITLDSSPLPNPSIVNTKIGLSTDISMNTLIGKSYGGIELSGGQWQKLAILRCLHSNSSIIILDEPTSAIDPKSEAELYEDFKYLSNGKLSLMITHRLGSVNNTDRILVIENGEIVQDGKPQSLKYIEGPFKELWVAQANMYT